MSRIRFARGENDRRLVFWCPGCDGPHMPRIEGAGVLWTWNGDSDKPTLQPSILVTLDIGHCHSFVTDGQIQFLPDSTHALAGHTVELPHWPYADGVFEGVER